MKDSDIIFICVNTPSKTESDGTSVSREADMRNFFKATDTIAQFGDKNSHKVLIEKSTVPVGTHKNIWDILKKHNENPDDVFTIVSMPEFLAEGVAIHNLLHPDRIVIGTPQNENGENSFKLLANLYTSIENTQIINVRQASSELGKLFSNAMLAQRISSVNSLSELCEITGASVQDLRTIVGSDKRIGMPFLCASLAWGGSCFEKDILSLAYILESNGLIEAARYWESVLSINNAQKKRLCDKVQANLAGEGHVAILGFAFKNKTSDTRMTPVSFVANYFMEKNVMIKVTDPQATEEGYKMEMEFMHYPIPDAYSKYCGSNLDEAVTGAQAIVVCTEWEEFQQMTLEDWKRVRALMTPKATIYDFRSYLCVKTLKEAGFDHVFKLGNPL